MNDLIKWEEDSSIESYVGIVGKLPILEVSFCSGDMFGYTVFEHADLENPEEWDEAKNKITEHFLGWLALANLILKPTKCGKCGDRGFYPNPEFDPMKDIIAGGGQNKAVAVDCPCRTDPKSLWYFNNVVMEEG